MIQINWNPTRRELRQFGAIWLPLFLAVVGAIVYFKTHAFTVPAVLWSAAAVACLFALAAPSTMRPVYLGLTLAAFPIGWTISHVLMAIIFYGVVTPIGFVMRLCGRDPMQRKFDHTATTYWTPHAAENDTRRYFRQF